MNGVMIPEVSAGSNQVGASEIWTAHVICPSGAASARLPQSALLKTRTDTKRPSETLTRLMDVLRQADSYMLASRRGEVGIIREGRAWRTDRPPLRPALPP